MTDRTPTPAALRAALDRHDLPALFRDLGWDNPSGPTLTEEAGGHVYTFTPVSRKASFVVLRANPDANGKMPERNVIQTLERKLNSKAAERLVVYENADGSAARWVWVKREKGQADRLRTEDYQRGAANTGLVQTLDGLYITLSEDIRGLTTADVSRKIGVMDVEKVTATFYREFDKVRQDFLKQITGLEGEDREHYASLTLNRLMFVYFIQKKKYLDNNVNYLQERLQRVQQQRGTGQFQTFYRAFLLHLFHRGLGATSRDAALTALIGRVPYLNGGLFEEHRIEAENTTIDIPDAAFEKIFAFFEGWRWTIDDREQVEYDPNAKPEINPDVLGYIFEQYINDRAKVGAYYTKEDITEYISKSTILPFILERTREGCRVAFEGKRSVWDLLKAGPDLYIHAAMRHGTDRELPDYIQEGVDPEQPDLLEKRKVWNKRADPEFGLPTEIWRETVARRQRYFEVRGKLERGEVRSVPDLITLNLDIIAFTQDVIQNADGPDLIEAIWNALTGMTVLDPTCGSGAFLFAAAGILAPLYRLCLERMQEMVDALPAGSSPGKLRDFKETLVGLNQHDADYFVLKQIIIRNLYGVDIIAEAVEIAKLRLFLKLIAYSRKIDEEPNMNLEPLPDIDFNIRVGNTLVGYVTEAEAEDAVRAKLWNSSGLSWTDIQAKTEEVDRRYTQFREQQLTQGGQADLADKHALQDSLASLETVLNEYLAGDYGIDKQKKPIEYDEWEASHKPFHWYVEFHGVIKNGGFDCLIGNPPYVEYRKVKSQYTVKNYETLECNDLYAFTLERASKLTSPTSSQGFIVPISLPSVDGFATLRGFYDKRSSLKWISSYAERPSKLFTGVEKRLSIILELYYGGENKLYTSSYRRWNSVERSNLFDLTSYIEIAKTDRLISGALPKISNDIELQILRRVSEYPILRSYYLDSDNIVLYTRKLRYFVQFYNFIPKIYDSNNEVTTPSELKQISFHKKGQAQLALAALNSNFFFWFFNVFSDVRNVNKREIDNFPVADFNEEQIINLSVVSERLMGSFLDNSEMITGNYKSVGKLTVQTFRPRKSKAEIDSIDHYLSDGYKLSPEQLDYVINYDVKYRMGIGGESDE